MWIVDLSTMKIMNRFPKIRSINQWNRIGKDSDATASGGSMPEKHKTKL